MYLGISTLFSFVYVVYKIASCLTGLSEGQNVTLLISLTFYSILLSLILLFGCFWLFYAHLERRIGRIENRAPDSPRQISSNQSPENPGLITAAKKFFSRKEKAKKRIETKQSETQTMLLKSQQFSPNNSISIKKVNLSSKKKFQQILQNDEF